ncbi:MAG: single-stranded DNA-binding protein [Algoriphagus sp.]|jgi:single-strand DNA-binding protein|uniref:single-stranded DNA-binding protein n=1 Tax=Algoriphagus sp. TaxID=1872435 RepID=UPI00271F3725|nr:single-stranded DNA-binding protein [Algoriphagus sp.]MDO8967686.1 single-stranded DNA-binding protein [Algoriphagus sp.]MDP2041945.1 single-stranded DNA-binding protein [Algoriphagus sp.]MDP3199970.1 single-stranded DNA-binding protein [Algoriphagus sp.]MDP3474132.1 single-stranded DNA-binding protein [Algoriphagus sp.]
MAGVNKVILVGNLGADPEVKYLEGDKAVAKLRLATTESYKDRNGNRVDQTEWHDLEMWDGQAKIAEQYLKKGSQLYVEGKIKTDSWQDEQGQNRYRTKIRVLSFTMLGGKPEGMGGGQAPNAASTANPKPAATSGGGTNSSPDLVLDDADDDLPF